MGPRIGGSRPARPAGPQSEPEVVSGLRERKRQQTRQAIIDAGMRLFLEKGYDATTLDEIAAVAGISRRTVFAYFGSKEDIVLASADDGFVEAIRTALANRNKRAGPFEAVYEVLPALVSRFENEQTLAIDELLRSTPALRARKNAFYSEIEQSVYEASRDVFSAEDDTTLRLVAMLAAGVLRVAAEKWRQDHGKPSFGAHVRQALAALKAEVRRST